MEELSNEGKGRWCYRFRGSTVVKIDCCTVLFSFNKIEERRARIGQVGGVTEELVYCYGSALID